MKGLVVVLVWIVLLGGLYPLFRLWQLPTSKFGRSLLAVMSGSYVWCLVGVVFPSALGPHYSDARLAIIQGNLLGSLGFSVAALILLPRKVLALVAGSWLAAIWLYVRTVSFVA